MFIRRCSAYACPVLILLQASVYGRVLGGRGGRKGKKAAAFCLGLFFFQAEKFSGDYKRHFLGEVEKDPLKCPICCRVWDLGCGGL